MSVKPLRDSSEGRNAVKNPAVLLPQQAGVTDLPKSSALRGVTVKKSELSEIDERAGDAGASAGEAIDLSALTASTSAYQFEPLQLAQAGAGAVGGSAGAAPVSGGLIGGLSATTVAAVAAVGVVGIAAASSGGGSGTPQNLPPAFGTAPDVTGLEDAAAITGAVKATDPEAGAITYSIKNQGAAGSATIDATTGSFSYKPNANASGSDKFVVSAKDPSGLVTEQTVTVTVTPVNDAPAFAATTVSAKGTEDVALTGTAVATDIEGTPLTYTIKGTGAANGTAVVDAKTGSYTYTPKANFNGDDKFVIVASDGALNAEQEVNVTLQAVNDAPVINPASTKSLEVPAGEGRSFVIDASDVDVPLQTLTLSVSSQPASGKILAGNIYQPNPGFTGDDKFTLSVSDGTDTTKHDISVKVLSNNLPPAFPAPEVSVEGLEDVAVTGVVKATDPEQSALVYSVVTDPTKGTLTLVPGTGAYTYKSNADYNGADSFVVSAKDPSGNVTATNLTVNLKLAEVNDAPRFATTSVVVTGTENTVLNGTVSAKDPEGTAVTYSAKAGGLTSGKVVIDETSGAYTYTPKLDSTSADSFVVIASDGKESSEQTVNVTLAALKTVSLDLDNDGNLSTIAPVELGTGAFRLTDSRDTQNRAEVTGFSADDFIEFNGPSSEYSFAYLGSTATLTVSTTFNNTVISSVNIAGVSIPSGAAFSEASAELGLAAAFGVSGTDFFRFSDSTGNGGTIVNKLTSLDYDNDSNISTFQQFNANEPGPLNVVYTDSTKIDSRASITNFGRSSEGVGDTIAVDSSTSLWSFASSNKVGSAIDIDISYSDGAKISAIKLLGVVPLDQNVTVLSEATAERALGYDFFKSSEPINSGLQLDSGAGDRVVRTFDAGAGANQYIDDVSKDSFVKIANIGPGDSVTVSNLSDTAYTRTSSGYFSSLGQDIVFAARSADGGKVSSITLVGVNPAGSAVYNEALAEQVVGFDFFRFA